MPERNTPLRFDGDFGGVIQLYGHLFLDDLERCRENPFWNLVDVARKYGISRERVRQLYKRVYKEPYRPTQKGLTQNKNEDISCSNDPRNKVYYYTNGSTAGKGAHAELNFLQRCLENNLNVEIPCDSSVDLIVNGYLVDVKYREEPKVSSQGCKTRYFNYRITKEQIDRAEFFACYHPIEDSFFIIPNIKWKGRKKPQHIYISNQKSTYFNAKNRHWQYQDRYDLLHT